MSAPSIVTLEPDACHIWSIDLERIGTSPPAVLSADERSRGERLRQPRDRVRWTASRVALRQILARYSGDQPAELQFIHGVRGKPALAGGSPLRFSLAHAQERAVLAVAWEREVGIDLEPIDTGLDVSPLLAAACGQTEAAQIDALRPNVRRETFLAYWTLKEAYLKGIGDGLSRDPRAIEVNLLPGGRASVRDPESAVPSPEWSVRLLEPGPGWIAALAISGQDPSLLVYRWPPLEIALTSE